VEISPAGLNIPCSLTLSDAVLTQKRFGSVWHRDSTRAGGGPLMKPFTLFPALVVISAMSLVPVSAEDPESQSAAAVVSLEAMLTQQKLDAIAARDPDHPGQYIAAFYMPGTQLLVVSAPYAVPAAIDKKIAAGQYMDAYVDLQSVADHTGHFFVVDMQADGLRKALKLDEAFDSTSVENGAPVSFDGRWEAQKLTEEQYNARFAQDDERYARMLNILRAALARKTT
jgi:hypothetical protein